LTLNESGDTEELQPDWLKRTVEFNTCLRLGQPDCVEIAIAINAKRAFFIIYLE
jgi:hypothetical protein